MKGFITPALCALLCALLLWCVCPVRGDTLSEHNPPSALDMRHLQGARQEEKYLLTEAVVQKADTEANSNYKEQRGYSKSLDLKSRIDNGQEIEPSINAGGQPQLSVPRAHLDGLSSDQSDELGESDLPCPVAAAIAPCICSHDAAFNIDLDCTLVESEEQLTNVFKQEFPVKELRGFNMTENSVIRVLDNILNGVTFRSVYLYPGPFALEEVSDYFLLNMKETLSYFDIRNSQLTSTHFPFAILDEMTKIWYLRMYKSQITWIPKIELPNVTQLRFHDGLTSTIEFGTFPIYADTWILGIERNVIEHIEPGSFYYTDENSMASNEEVLIDVSGNRLQTVAAGTVPMRNGYMFLRFYNNQISSVAPGAFVMPATTDNLSIKFELHLNLLTTIDEEVYGEMMPYIITLYINGNPLTCGCDIAWIVTNPDYIAKIDPDATCADGTNMHSLDPAGYIELC